MYLALFINKTLYNASKVCRPSLTATRPLAGFKKKKKNDCLTKILYTDIQVRLVVALAVTFFENYSLDNIAVFRNMIGMSVSAK